MLLFPVVWWLRWTFFFLRWEKVSKREKTSDTENENENYYFLWWSDKRHFPYNSLGLTDEDNSVSWTDNFVNVNVFNSVTSARVLCYRWVLHYFSTIPVGRIKIVTVYKWSIFQVEWLIATLILCISHCSESDSLSSRVFYSAVSTTPRFLFEVEVKSKITFKNRNTWRISLYLHMASLLVFCKIK